MSRGWFRDVKIYVEWENEKYAKYFFSFLRRWVEVVKVWSMKKHCYENNRRIWGIKFQHKIQAKKIRQECIKKEKGSV